MEWSGPAIRPGLDNRHLIIEGHRRSWKVMEGQGRSRKVWIDISGEKSYGWVGSGRGGSLKDYSVSPSPSPFPLDLGFGTWILGLGFGTGLGLYNKNKTPIYISSETRLW